MTTIVWFRQDLRMADNPALISAAARGPVVPVYVLDETSSRPLGGASRWWLHHSLLALKQKLGGLVLMRGDPADCLRRLIDHTGATAVSWNRCYEPQAIERDKSIKSNLGALGLEVLSANGSLLHEPWELKTGAGGPFKIYSPFWRAAQQRPVVAPLPAPSIELNSVLDLGLSVDQLELLPYTHNWAEGWPGFWAPGEIGAQQRLEAFLAGGLKGYGTLRDRPDLPNVSRLSPHLHFGELSPRQVWAKARFTADAEPELAGDVEKFLSELAWRDFSHHLLFHFPSFAKKNWRPAFDEFPWQDDAPALEAWQKGQTGYPIVDAGMRELWQTGSMHNRVRMVAASFLIKHLRLHWKHGEAWFWDTLVDADMANNSAGWQWVAGSGADASPYFRIFNPITQGRKFDPDGAYVRRWCPEIAGLPTSFVHAPFEAPPGILAQAGVRLGKDYPTPMVDHATARAAALAGYQMVRAANA